MKILFVLSTLMLLNFANASELIPVYPNSVCENQVCVSKAVGRKQTQINISTILIPLHSVDYKAHLLLNGKEIASERIMVRDRSNVPSASLVIPSDLEGSVEIYFENGRGTYISDYGRNFHFSLELK